LTARLIFEGRTGQGLSLGRVYGTLRFQHDGGWGAC
jgi:hypothetical protein